MMEYDQYAHAIFCSSISDTPKYAVGQVLMLVSDKTREHYKVKVMGSRVVMGEHATDGWYYGLNEVGSRGRLLRERSLASEGWIEEHEVVDKE